MKNVVGTTKGVIVITLALVLAAVPSAKASVSSIGFDLIPPLIATASPGGDINAATSFTFTDLGSTNNTSGIFAGLPQQDFCTVTFDTGAGTSLIIRSPEFGIFASTTITTVANFSGFLNLLIDGTYTPGSFESTVTGTSDADLRLGLTQTPPMNGQISVSGTMSTTPAAVLPEPSTAVLFLSGLGIVLAGSRLRKVVS